jgi:catechol 2,3-dioxygenase-like lactoylglutathione lyase family enzyme
MSSYDAVAPTAIGFTLHHVQLSPPPGSEDVARAFWVEDLGFTELRKPPELATRGGVWLRADALEVHIGVETDFEPQRKAHPGILVADLDALAARLTDRGHEVMWDDAFPGMRRFYTRDPFGNRLEFLSPAGGAAVPW